MAYTDMSVVLACGVSGIACTTYAHTKSFINSFQLKSPPKLNVNNDSDNSIVTTTTTTTQNAVHICECKSIVFIYNRNNRLSCQFHFSLVCE